MPTLSALRSDRVGKIARDLRETSGAAAGDLAHPTSPCRLTLIRGPARVVVVFLEFTARDPAAEHRTGEPPLVGAEREIDVDHHHGDQRHGGKAVQHVNPTP